MGKKPEILQFNAEDRPSSFSIKRDGKRITLTNGEVYRAAEAMLQRVSAEAVLFFADVYGGDMPRERRKVIEDNIVNTVMRKLPREVLEQANMAMGGEDAPSIEDMFDIK